MGRSKKKQTAPASATTAPPAPAENEAATPLASPVPIAEQSAAQEPEATGESVENTAPPPALAEGAETEDAGNAKPDELTVPPEAPATSRPLWTNFNEAPPDANVKAAEAAHAKKLEREKAELHLLDGFARFICLRDNGSGKYRQGRTYVLPSDQHPELFRKVD